MKIASITETGVLLDFDNEEEAVHESASLVHLMRRRVGLYDQSCSGSWWERWDSASAACSGRRVRAQSFTVTATHIRLIQRSWSGWNNCEFGAAEIDPKRPYGNSSVYHDIAGIIGLKPDEEGDFSDEEYAMMARLHRETQVCLEILLGTLGLEAGEYRNEGGGYGMNKWVRA